MIIKNQKQASSLNQRIINIFQKYNVNNFSDFSGDAISDFDDMFLRHLYITPPYSINLYNIVQIDRSNNNIGCSPLTTYFAIGRKAMAKRKHDIDSDYHIFTESRDFCCNHTFNEVSRFLEVVADMETYLYNTSQNRFVMNHYRPSNVSKGDNITLNIYDIDTETNFKISGTVDIAKDCEWDDGSDRGPYHKTYNFCRDSITFYSVENYNSTYYYYIHAANDGYYYRTISRPFLHMSYDNIQERGESIILRSKDQNKVEEVYDILMQVSGYYTNKPTHLSVLSNMYNFKEFDYILENLKEDEIKKYKYWAQKHICFWIKFPYTIPKLNKNKCKNSL